MQEKTLVLSTPMFVLEFSRDESTMVGLDDMVGRLRADIELHPCARFLGVFDHFAHTRSLPDGEIAPGIEDARNIVFCFGLSIPDPCALATRPRSIGLCQLADRFVVSFIEHPMPLVNTAMEGWARNLVRKGAAPGLHQPDAAAVGP